MEKLPIVIDGVTAGSLELRREGAYMLCRGQVRWSGDVVRLWLYGEGTPSYLGVLLPEENGMARIRKKFSMSDYAKLPHPLAYCATESSQKQGRADQSAEEAVYWYARSDGTLTRKEGGRCLVAFPAQGVRLPRGGEFLLRVIDGKQYVIFPG